VAALQVCSAVRCIAQQEHAPQAAQGLPEKRLEAAQAGMRAPDEPGLWGHPYPVPRNELTCPAADIDACQPQPAGDCAVRCGYCGASGPEANLEVTKSCGMTVCNREAAEYKPCSYSRRFCTRCRKRYMRCGAHKKTQLPDEKHHEACADWRDCRVCLSIETLRSDPEKLWTGANGYQLCVPRPHPKGTLWTTTCDQCHRRVHQGVEAHAWHLVQDMKFLICMCNECKLTGPLPMKSN
jgi:hypothetical protein